VQVIVVVTAAAVGEVSGLVGSVVPEVGVSKVNQIGHCNNLSPIVMLVLEAVWVRAAVCLSTIGARGS
jgi:hypothetical protein